MRLSFVSALLATEAAALVAHHRHGHPLLHKKALEYQHTEVVTEVVWTTKTVYDDDVTTSATLSVFKGAAPQATSVSSSSTSTSTIPSVAPPPPPPASSPSAQVAAPVPTTAAAPEPAKQVAVENISPPAADTQDEAPPPAATTAAPPPLPATTQAAPPAPAASQPSNNQGADSGSNGGSGSGSSGSSTPAPSSSGNKRGLAYNDAGLTAPFLGAGTKCSWAYNWGQTPDKFSAQGVEYVPMLWGPIPIHTNTWSKNAEAALSNGAKNLLSFNECDNGGQCNKSPGEAAAAHIQLMNPYAGRARISSPAITNSNIAGEGLDWLKAWVQACNGQCKFDFCAAHWYSPPDPADLLGHLDKVHEICQGKPVWLTEFEPISGDKAKFLADVMKELDTNPKYSYVERYSYFMVATGNTLDGPATINTVGKTFAYQ